MRLSRVIFLGKRLLEFIKWLIFSQHHVQQAPGSSYV